MMHRAVINGEQNSSTDLMPLTILTLYFTTRPFPIVVVVFIVFNERTLPHLQRVKSSFYYSLTYGMRRSVRSQGFVNKRCVTHLFVLVISFCLPFLTWSASVVIFGVQCVQSL